MELTTPTGHLEHLRYLEIEVIRRFLRPGSKILDIGGGTGYQARLIADHGCDVLSVDIPGAEAHTQFFSVQPYDGVNLPGDSEAFDVLFTSNVLEHVRDLEALLKDMKRVLKKDGIVIHILPSPSWRFWTSLAFYPYLCKNLFGRGERVAGMDTSPITMKRVGSTIKKRGLLRAVGRVFTVPLEPHGEFRNALVELYYYSRMSWRKRFQANGWSVQELFGNELFYTGHSIFPRLPYTARRRMSHILGSSCNIFVLQKHRARSVH